MTNGEVRHCLLHC